MECSFTDALIINARFGYEGDLRDLGIPNRLPATVSDLVTQPFSADLEAPFLDEQEEQEQEQEQGGNNAGRRD